VRTPLVVMQFYEGAVGRAQNVWRRWMIAHNMPHPGGRAIEPMTGACSSHQVEEMLRATEENQKHFVDRYLAEKIQLDYWWMDAGWYVNTGSWTNTGTWEVDTKRFPRGLRAVSDHIRAKGVKSLLWFEPERVNAGTKLFREHPEFLLSKPDGGDKLLNLGDERARKWAVEMVGRTMTEQGIDLFRSDFNIDPLPYWRANDAEDRQGITEIRYVEGFLAYWDELHARRPNLIIDTCASGGRRNDLETLRRAVPLLRSDYILEPVGQQNHTLGIARWIPYYGTGANSTDAYVFRSQMCPWFTACYDVRRTDLDYDALRKLHGQWKRAAPLFMKDFYPLTPYATENTAWVAWQFHDPETGQGVVQAFRRGESFYEAASLKLQGLDETARYVVTDVDGGKDREVSGRELSEGLSVALKARPAAGLIMYRRVE
jgi:alpha-galactosidase